MRWNIGRHADRDAARAVDQQLRQARREHRRFGSLTIEIRNEIDGVFVDIGEHLHRDAR